MDGVNCRGMMDELLNLPVSQALAGLRLPIDDAIFSNPLIKLMTGLLSAKGNEKNEIPYLA